MSHSTGEDVPRSRCSPMRSTWLSVMHSSVPTDTNVRRLHVYSAVKSSLDSRRQRFRWCHDVFHWMPDWTAWIRRYHHNDCLWENGGFTSRIIKIICIILVVCLWSAKADWMLLKVWDVYRTATGTLTKLNQAEVNQNSGREVSSNNEPQKGVFVLMRNLRFEIWLPPQAFSLPERQSGTQKTLRKDDFREKSKTDSLEC